MKATGIVRRIDDLGRVVIPKEIRRTLRIREGDPLEIFTDHEGDVIFKKYSQIGDLQEVAGQLCETVYKTAGCPTVVTDRDSVVAASGVSRRELSQRRISAELEQIMEGRRLYAYHPGEKSVSVIENGGDCYPVALAAPILSGGDVMGCIVMSGREGSCALGETETKLAQVASGFLGRHMEA